MTLIESHRHVLDSMQASQKIFWQCCCLSWMDPADLIVGVDLVPRPIDGFSCLTPLTHNLLIPQKSLPNRSTLNLCLVMVLVTHWMLGVHCGKHGQPAGQI